MTDAQADLTRALGLAEAGDPEVQVVARAHLACLPRGDLAAALAAFAKHESRLGVHEKMEARFLLWQATGDRAHLVEAKRLFDFLVAHAPPECREAMLANVRLHREIAEAWKVHGTAS